MKSDALTRALDKAGGRDALALALGISGPAISQWNRIPAERVLEIERATGVSRTELRPDLYPPEDSGVDSAKRDPSQFVSSPADVAPANEAA